MFGTLSEEMEVKVPASEAWKLYGTLKLANLSAESLPDLFDKIEVVQGDGGVGTILQLFFPPGTPGMTSRKEKLTVVDNSKLVKEAEVVEGGYLNFGFTLFRVRLQVIEKEEKSDCCITKGTIEYEVKEEAAKNASLVSIQPLQNIMKIAADYLIHNYNSEAKQQEASVN